MLRGKEKEINNEDCSLERSLHDFEVISACVHRKKELKIQLLGTDRTAGRVNVKQAQSERGEWLMPTRSWYLLVNATVTVLS